MNALFVVLLLAFGSGTEIEEKAKVSLHLGVLFDPVTEEEKVVCKCVHVIVTYCDIMSCYQYLTRVLIGPTYKCLITCISGVISGVTYTIICFIIYHV